MGAFKRDFVNNKDVTAFREDLPQNISNIIQDGVSNEYIKKSSQIHYYILNLNASEVKH